MAKTAENLNEVMLVLRCQSGDKAAFDDLLRAVQTRLWRYISNLTADPALAEDILQEVFLIIYKKIGWLSDPKLFRPWVYRIASRETFRTLKKRTGRREDPPGDEILDQVSAKVVYDTFDREMIDRLPAMLKNVSPASRAVLILHYLEELSIGETAEILDISPGTAKSRLAYGLSNLRRQFEVL